MSRIWSCVRGNVSLKLGRRNESAKGRGSGSGSGQRRYGVPLGPRWRTSPHRELEIRHQRHTLIGRTRNLTDKIPCDSRNLKCPTSLHAIHIAPPTWRHPPLPLARDALSVAHLMLHRRLKLIRQRALVPPVPSSDTPRLQKPIRRRATISDHRRRAIVGRKVGGEG